MRSKVIRIGVAIVLATVGTVVLVRYVQSARDDAVAADAVVSVLVVDQPIPKGTVGAELEGKVHVEQVPVKVKAEGALADLASVVDLHTGVALVPGEQVVRSRFVTAGRAARGEAPDGLLQVTVSLDAERALGGHLRPGDHVAVLLTFDPAEGDKEGDKATESTTRLQLHKVLVTGVQGQPLPTGEDATENGVGPAPTGGYLVTLAADADDVELIVFAREQGKIWLSDEPTEAPGTATAGVDRRTVTTGSPS